MPKLIVSIIIMPGRAYGKIPRPILDLLNLHCLRSPVKVQQCLWVSWDTIEVLRHGDEVRDDDEVRGSPPFL